MLLLRPEDIDDRLNWTLGRAERLARRGVLPHVVLPDRAIRFQWEAVKETLHHVAGNGVDRQAIEQPADGSSASQLDHLFKNPDGFVPRLIRKKAESLARRPEFRGADAEDIAQELSYDLAKRHPRYDPARARLTTFVFRVLRTETADLIEKAVARKRRGRRAENSLGDAPLDEARRHQHRGVAGSDDVEHFELAEDVATATASLSPHLQERCQMLMEGLSPTAIAKAKGIPPEAVQEDLDRIRRHLVDHDLDAYV